MSKPKVSKVTVTTSGEYPEDSPTSITIESIGDGAFTENDYRDLESIILINNNGKGNHYPDPDFTLTTQYNGYDTETGTYTFTFESTSPQSHIPKETGSVVAVRINRQNGRPYIEKCDFIVTKQHVE